METIAQESPKGELQREGLTKSYEIMRSARNGELHLLCAAIKKMSKQRRHEKLAKRHNGLEQARPAWAAAFPQQAGGRPYRQEFWRAPGARKGSDLDA